MDSREVEEKINDKEKEEQHVKKEKLWKIIAIILSIFLIISLVIWATSTEKIRVFPLIGGIIFIIIVFVSLFWGIGWYRKFQELQDKISDFGKLPPAITIEQAAELIDLQLKNPRYADYVQGWKDHRLYNIGKGIKNRILLVHLDLIYSEKPYNFYLINLHYPKEMWNLVTQDKYNPGELIRLMNALAVYPEDEPDERETIQENVLTGNKITTKEKIQHKKEDKKEKEKGDLE